MSETTQRVSAQERQHLLLRETNHRLKNLFAMIDALIRLSVRSARTPHDFAHTLRGRLAALLRAKELIRPGIMGNEEAVVERTTVDTLVRTILQPYEDERFKERITVTGPEVVVGSTATTSLALALHEITTNAVKYGALSDPIGAVRITWETQGNNFRLDWNETAGPAIVGNPDVQGFGSVLTRQSIVGQLGGKIDYEWQPDGLKLKITIPLDRLSI